MDKFISLLVLALNFGFHPFFDNVFRFSCLPMLYIYRCTTARALDIVEIKEITFFNDNITFLVLEHGIALVADNLPRSIFVIILYNFHNNFYLTIIVPNYFMEFLSQNTLLEYPCIVLSFSACCSLFAAHRQ